MSAMTFPVQQASGSALEAEVLLNPTSFSPRYDLDRVSGSFSRTGHPLKGQKLAGKILACPGVQGGVAGGWAFLAMRGAGVGPAALLFGRTNPVMVQGAVTAGLTIVAGVEPHFFDTVNNGDWLRIDPAAMTVEVRPRES